MSGFSPFLKANDAQVFVMSEIELQSSSNNSVTNLWSFLFFVTSLVALRTFFFLLEHDNFQGILFLGESAHVTIEREHFFLSCSSFIKKQPFENEGEISQRK